MRKITSISTNNHKRYNEEHPPTVREKRENIKKKETKVLLLIVCQRRYNRERYIEVGMYHRYPSIPLHNYVIHLTPPVNSWWDWEPP